MTMNNIRNYEAFRFVMVLVLCLTLMTGAQASPKGHDNVIPAAVPTVNTDADLGSAIRKDAEAAARDTALSVSMSLNHRLRGAGHLRVAVTDTRKRG